MRKPRTGFALSTTSGEEHLDYEMYGLLDADAAEGKPLCNHSPIPSAHVETGEIAASDHSEWCPNTA